MGVSMDKIDHMPTKQTGHLYSGIGTTEPIREIHAVGKICILFNIWKYTIMQLITLILKRIGVKRTFSLLFILLTWSPLCDGQRLVVASVPFQSPVRHGNTVMGVTRGNECFLQYLGPSDYYRQEWSQPEQNLLSKDGSFFGSLCLHPWHCLMCSNFVSLPIFDPEEYPKMSSGQEEAADKEESFITSSMRSVIKALSGTNTGTLTSTKDAEAFDRNQQSSSSAEEVTELGRDLRDDFERLLDDASGSNGIMDSQVQKPNSETLISLLDDCNADVSTNGVGSQIPERSSLPELHSLFGGLSHREANRLPPGPFHTHERGMGEGGVYGTYRYPVERVGEPSVNFTSRATVSAAYP